jgi:phosphoribosylaminoimidazole carboxylase/phosphoribosylaminoimidazole-succinocarboxamide synthase
MQDQTVQHIGRGKTKILHAAEDSSYLIDLESTEDITAGDGDKHDTIPGKGAWATRTTCNVFRLLKACGIPVAFAEQRSPTVFRAPRCRMLEYEVVVRREAHGSFLHRYPHVPTGHYFPKLVIEFFAKTKDLNWRGNSIPMDDPLLDFSGEDVLFYLPHFNKEQKKESAKTGFMGHLVGQKPFLILPRSKFFTLDNEQQRLEQMGDIAKRTFLILEKAWQLLGRHLVDFKVEFGLDGDGKLLLADVIDSDSWRLVKDGKYQDKQIYRDGAPLDKVAEKYRLAAELTDQFGLPSQCIIIWSGSPKDDTKPLQEAIATLSGGAVKTIFHVRSTHKEPELGLLELWKLIQEYPLSVFIADIGMSNGAGPLLSAHAGRPVITIPKNWKEFPPDVWSSLRTPSDVPVSTVLNPANAVLHALQILALSNPQLYSILQFELEKRMINTVQV